jgi:hypothetical protein
MAIFNGHFADNRVNLMVIIFEITTYLTIGIGA